MLGIPQVYIYLALGVGSAAAGSLVTYQIQQSRLVSLRATIDSTNAANATKAIRLIEQRIEEGDKIEAKIKELSDAEEAIRADLTDTVSSLHSKVANLSRRLRANSGATADSQAAAKVGDLFNTCTERYKELERFATSDRLAGMNCEQRYDSLRESLKEKKDTK